VERGSWTASSSISGRDIDACACANALPDHCFLSRGDRVRLGRPVLIRGSRTTNYWAEDPERGLLLDYTTSCTRYIGHAVAMGRRSFGGPVPQDRRCSIGSEFQLVVDHPKPDDPAVYYLYTTLKAKGQTVAVSPMWLLIAAVDGRFAAGVRESEIPHCRPKAERRCMTSPAQTCISSATATVLGWDHSAGGQHRLDH